MAEASYYIDFNLILRFSKIFGYTTSGGSNNDHKDK